MSEPEYLSAEMVNTLRTMGLLMWPATHGAWRLLGHIDWLEQKLDSIADYPWRER